MALSNKAYNVLKWIALVGLPAFSSCYYGLSGIWGLPYAEQVVGTAAVIATFLGVLLGISTSQYNKQDNTHGSVIVDPETEHLSIRVNGDLEDLSKKATVTLNVRPRGKESTQ